MLSVAAECESKPAHEQLGEHEKTSKHVPTLPV